MRPLVQEISGITPEWAAMRLRTAPGLMVLRTSQFESAQARYSFVVAEPFLVFRSYGSRCELTYEGSTHVQFGSPWQVLDGLMARYESLDELDFPFPLGGCFGFWGYDLKNFVEPKLPRRASNDLELPDCHVGFYGTLVAFDHRMDKAWLIATGMSVDGTASESAAVRQRDLWLGRLQSPARLKEGDGSGAHGEVQAPGESPFRPRSGSRLTGEKEFERDVESSWSRGEFVGAVEKAQRYIRSGDIYQVNLSHRLAASLPADGWSFFQRLTALSPAPHAAFLDCGDFQIASSSPELFLRLSGSLIQTRPIKGTRPRSADPTRDAQLTYELQTSPKEMAELVMITDLLRNDLGKVCEYGSVHVPELVRLERYSQVQHLVSTVEGRLRTGTTHFSAFASCFPGGSITGAPKIRAMEIIDELEPITRGPYTGALGYLGFNREAQLSIIIRTALCVGEAVYFHVGAGIVADSIPDAEYEETLAKARGFFQALNAPAYSEWHLHGGLY